MTNETQVKGSSAASAEPAVDQKCLPDGIRPMLTTTLNARQLHQAWQLGNPDPGDDGQEETEITIRWWPGGKDTDGDESPAGYYAHLSEYPEEGSLFLDPERAIDRATATQGAPTLDNCERCKGARGGVRGNENVINGQVLCDYCTVDAQGAPTPAQPLNGIRANAFHDEGARAQCGECGRYTLDSQALFTGAPPCECGSTHGWSGSFKKPGPDARWSVPGPAAVEGWRTSADGLSRVKVAPDAAAPMVPSESVSLRMGADGRLKPWQKTSWNCARARVDQAGLHCPVDRCADCPAAGIQPTTAQAYECAECSRPDCNWKGDCDGESCPACDGHVVIAGQPTPAQGEASPFEAFTSLAGRLGWDAEQEYAGGLFRDKALQALWDGIARNPAAATPPSQTIHSADTQGLNEHG